MQRFLSKLGKISKICSIICGTLLIVHSLHMLYISESIHPKNFMLSFNYIMLACFLVISEFHVGCISVYLNLIDGIIGRGIYTIFLGTLLVDDPSNTMSFVLSIIFLLVGLSYIIMGILNEKDNPNKQKLVEYVQKDDNEAGDIQNVSVPVIKI